MNSKIFTKERRHVIMKAYAVKNKEKYLMEKFRHHGVSNVIITELTKRVYIELSCDLEHLDFMVKAALKNEFKNYEIFWQNPPF